MIRVSSFLFRNVIKKLKRPSYIGFYFSKTNRSSETMGIIENKSMEGSEMFNLDEDSAFERIAPDNLHKEILIALNAAQDIEQVIRVYAMNKDKINQNNIAFILRNINLRFHTIYKENAVLIAKNSHLKGLISYIKANIEQLNAQTLVEVLTFYRKTKTNRLIKDFTYADEMKLCELINKLIIEQQMNPKLVGLVFCEYCWLKRNPSVPFQFLQDSIDDPNRNAYFTPHTIMLIIKGIIKVTTERRKYLDFAYKLTARLESGVGALNISHLCLLFNQICFLRLQITTSHKKNPPILSKIKELIDENKQALMEEDVINILEGYAFAPHTLDIKLFQYVKNSVLYTISEKPLNLSLNFLVNFVSSMSKQRYGMELSKESLAMIADELYKRFDIIEMIKLSVASDTLKAFLDHSYKPEKLHYCIYRKILEVPEEQYTLNVCLSIATSFLKQNFPIDQFLQKVFNRFKNEISDRHLEGIYKIFYVYTHPNVPNNEFLQNAADYVFKILMEQSKKNPTVSIKYLGNFFYHLRNKYLMELQTWALEETKKEWDKLSIYDKNNIALTFINCGYPENLWSNFLYSSYNNLSQEELASLLMTYELKNPKTFFNSDFVFKVANRSEAKHQVIRKIIDAIISTQREIIITKKGTPNGEIKILLDSLLTDSFTIDEMLVSYDIAKLDKTLKIFEIQTDFLPVLAVEYIDKTNFIEKNTSRHFQLAEMSDLLVDFVENFESYNVEKVKTSREKAINQLQQMNKIFTKSLEGQNIKAISLSLYIKLLNNIRLMCQIDPSVKDQVFIEMLMDNVLFIYYLSNYLKLFKKIDHITLDAHIGTVYHAIYFIMHSELTDFYHYDKRRLDNIAGKYKECLDSSSPIAILEHLKLLEKYHENLNLKLLGKFQEYIQNFYLRCNLQIYPNIIVSYLRYFGKTGTKNLQIYNKILKDTEKVFKDFKPKYLYDLIRSLSLSRIKHNTLFFEASKQFENNLSLFQRELPLLLMNYARVGFTTEWCQNFIKTHLSSFKNSKYEFEKYPKRTVEILWLMGLYDMNDSSLVSELSPIFEKFVLSEQWIQSEFQKLTINDLYLLYRNKHPGFEGYSLSEQVLEKFEETKLKRLVPINQNNDICTTLEEMGIAYEKNKQIDDVLIADIYLPKQSIGIFYISDHYATFHGTEDSGYQFMRNKILKYYEASVKPINIYAYHWNKFTTLQEKSDFLQKLGVQKEDMKIEGVS